MFPPLLFYLLHLGMVKARINNEFQAAIDNAAPMDYDRHLALTVPSRWSNWLFNPGKVAVYLFTQNLS